MTDSVQTGAAPAATPAGPNDAALAAKFDKQNETPGAAPAASADKPQRPEWVPEKFWNAEKGEADFEAMSKSYTELEKKQGKQAPKGAEKTPDDAESGDAKAAVTAAGLDFDAMSTEWAEKGDLSAETRTKLETAGFSKGQVDTYLAGLTAQRDSLLSAAHEGAGGADEFAAMQAWAQQNASEADLRAYNEMVASPDPAKVKIAVQGLFSKYAEAEGVSPKRVINGSGNAADVGDVYESTEQMKADMRKPEYKKDPAFRQKVQDKLARSSIM